MDDEYNIEEKQDYTTCPACGLRVCDEICPACGTAMSSDKSKEEEEEEYYERRREKR